MTLAFSTEINGEPTGFIPKIWAGLVEQSDLTWTDRNYFESKYQEKYGWDLFNQNWILYQPYFTPKVHTIRKDSKDRWKVGSKIHFVINNRTKDRFQFAPVLEVTRIQDIDIKYLNTGPRRKVEVRIDGDLFGNARYDANHLLGFTYALDCFST